MDADSLQRPDEEEQARIAERTRQALEKKIEGKIKAAQPKTGETQKEEPTYIRYTPGQAQQDDGHNSGAKQRIIRLQEMPTDPLEPPKFKSKKLPGGAPEVHRQQSCVAFFALLSFFLSPFFSSFFLQLNWCLISFDLVLASSFLFLTGPCSGHAFSPA